MVGITRKESRGARVAADHANCPSNYAWVLAISILPDVVSQHHNRLGARPFVLWREMAFGPRELALCCFPNLTQATVRLSSRVMRWSVYCRCSERLSLRPSIPA